MSQTENLGNIVKNKYHFSSQQTVNCTKYLEFILTANRYAKHSGYSRTGSL